MMGRQHRQDIGQLQTFAFLLLPFALSLGEVKPCSPDHTFCNVRSDDLSRRKGLKLQLQTMRNLCVSALAVPQFGF